MAAHGVPLSREPGPDADLLSRVTFEVIPLGGVTPERFLPPGTRVSVTASPRQGLDATVDLAIRLEEAGFRAVPHLAARLVRDRAHLDRVMARLAGAGIDRAFVVAGDGETRGPYPDSLTLLDTLTREGHHLTEIGVAGYPEGHPHIDPDTLMAALIRKQQLASYVTTQMCFSVPTLVSWIRDIRARGVELPVVVGVPGVVDRMRLLRVAAKIGVGPSVRYLRSNPGGLRLLRTFSPDPIIGSLLALPQLRDLGLAGLHVFTFNQLDTTWDWYRRVARLD